MKTFSVWIGVVFLLLLVCPSFAVREVFRADFENRSVGAHPAADAGVIESNSGSVVAFPVSGFANRAMRIYSGGFSYSQDFNFASPAAAGDCGLRWEMLLPSYPSGSTTIGFLSCYEDPENPGTFPCYSFSVATNGTIKVNSETVTSTNMSLNQVYQFSLHHDLSTGEVTLHMNGREVHSSLSSIRTRKRWHHISWFVGSGYLDVFYLDNIHAWNSQPYVPLTVSSFEAMPPVTPISDNDTIDGYSYGDFFTNVDYETRFGGDIFDVTTSPFSALDQSLRMYNRNNYGSSDPSINFNIRWPEIDYDEGRYRFFMDVYQSSSIGQVDVSVMDASAFAKFGIRLSAGNVSFSSGLLYRAWASLSNNWTHIMTKWNEQSSAYEIYIDGERRATNHVFFSNFDPRLIRGTTTDDDTGFNYIDNLGLERGGSDRLVLFKNLHNESDWITFRTSLGAYDEVSTVASNMFVSDACYGDDGLLYIIDNSNSMIRVHDPDTMLEQYTFSDAQLLTPLFVTALNSNRLAVLGTDGSDRSITVLDTVPTLSVHSVLTSNVFFGVAGLESSPDRDRIYVPYTFFVDVRHAGQGHRLTTLSAHTSLIPAIDDSAMGPDGHLYLMYSTASNTQVAGVNPQTDALSYYITEPSAAEAGQAFCVLANGDPAVAKIGTITDRSVMLFSGATGEAIGRMRYPGVLTGSEVMLASPKSATWQRQRRTGDTFIMDMVTERGRHYDIERASHLNGNGTWNPLQSSWQATGSQHRVKYTNSGTSGFFRFGETEL